MKQSDKSGREALMTACHSGNTDNVRALLAAGGDANTKTGLTDEGDFGETPLMVAARMGQSQIARVLLANGASPLAKTRRGMTALSFSLASNSPDMEIVRLLLNAGCPVDWNDLHYSVYLRELEIVKLLLTKSPDVNFHFQRNFHPTIKKGCTPLSLAVGRNVEEIIGPPLGVTKPREKLAIVKLLLASGADPNKPSREKNGWTPLMIAVACDEDKIAKALLDAGANPKLKVNCSRSTLVNGRYKKITGPLDAAGMAKERPVSKKVQRLLLARK